MHFFLIFWILSFAFFTFFLSHFSLSCTFFFLFPFPFSFFFFLFHAFSLSLSLISFFFLTFFHPFFSFLPSLSFFFSFSFILFLFFTSFYLFLFFLYVCISIYIYMSINNTFFFSLGLAMLSHHFISIFTLGISLLTGFYGTEVVATIFGSEVTNPLLQFRWFLKKSGYYESIVGNIVDVAFVLVFTYVRIVVGTYLFYCYLNMSHIPQLMKMASSAFYAVSFIFWITILRFAYRKCLSKYRHFKHAVPIDQSKYDNCSGSDQKTKKS